MKKYEKVLEVFYTTTSLKVELKENVIEKIKTADLFSDLECKHKCGYYQINKTRNTYDKKNFISNIKIILYINDNDSIISYNYVKNNDDAIETNIDYTNTKSLKEGLIKRIILPDGITRKVKIYKLVDLHTCIT